MKLWLFSAMAIALLQACAPRVSSDAMPVLANAPAPTPFTRAYSLTESLDGQVRVFAQEDGDRTQLMIMHSEGPEWSAPEPLNLPHRQTLTAPSFSFADGALYYSSDAELDARPGRSDLNIWRAAYLGDGRFGPPEILPLEIINTGANETSAAIARDGTMIFASNHSRAGGGGYDIMQAVETSDGDWHVEPLSADINDRLANDHLAIAPDGTWMMYYSHRTPKFGAVDIWRSNRGPDGNWLAPFNLGELVNTPAIEFGAGLSADGELLFFSRDGKLMQIPVTDLPIEATLED